MASLWPYAMATRTEENRGRKATGQNGRPKRLYIDDTFSEAKLLNLARKAGIHCRRPVSRLVNLALHKISEELK